LLVQARWLPAAAVGSAIDVSAEPGTVAENCSTKVGVAVLASTAAPVPTRTTTRLPGVIWAKAVETRRKVAPSVARRA
jgi:hypothetical protein